jgi:hypothetical protein
MSNKVEESFNTAEWIKQNKVEESS